MARSSLDAFAIARLWLSLIQTDFAKALWDNPQIRSAQENKAALKRIGQPDDIGGVAVFLASKAGNFVCGQTIIADGGVIGTGAE